jgi:hypothetical protein
MNDNLVCSFTQYSCRVNNTNGWWTILNKRNILKCHMKTIFNRKAQKISNIFCVHKKIANSAQNVALCSSSGKKYMGHALLYKFLFFVVHTCTYDDSKSLYAPIIIPIHCFTWLLWTQVPCLTLRDTLVPWTYRHSAIWRDSWGSSRSTQD